MCLNKRVFELIDGTSKNIGRQERQRKYIHEFNYNMNRKQLINKRARHKYRRELLKTHLKTESPGPENYYNIIREEGSTVIMSFYAIHEYLHSTKILVEWKPNYSN